MKLSKELLLQAVNAAFEFNAENNDADAHVSFNGYNITLGLNIFDKDGWPYYKISTNYTTDDDVYANSHEENLEGFIAALQEKSNESKDQII